MFWTTSTKDRSGVRREGKDEDRRTATETKDLCQCSEVQNDDAGTQRTSRPKPHGRVLDGIIFGRRVVVGKDGVRVVASSPVPERSRSTPLNLDEPFLDVSRYTPSRAQGLPFLFAQQPELLEGRRIPCRRVGSLLQWT